MVTLSQLRPHSVTIWPAHDERGELNGNWQVNVAAQPNNWRIVTHADPVFAFRQLGLDVSAQECLSIINTCAERRNTMGRPKGSTNKPKTEGETPKRASRAKAAPPAATLDSMLRAHLEFVSVATDDEHPHVRIVPMQQGSALMASNGTLTAGVLIGEVINAAPHVGRLIKALDAVGGEYSAVVEGTQLVVTGASTRVAVECVDPATLPMVQPDASTVEVNDTLRAVFKALEKIIAAKGQSLVESSLLVEADTAAASDAKGLIVQAWHGFKLPTLVLPKNIVSAVNKCGKALIGFGAGTDTATFWFSDGSFIQSRVFKEGEWPENWRTWLPNNLTDEFVPSPEFWQAYDKAAGFSDDGFVRIRDGVVASHADVNKGSVFQAGLPVQVDGYKLDVKRIKLVRPYMQRIGFADNREIVGFISDGEGVPRIRGAIAYEPDAEPEAQPAAPAVSPEAPLSAAQAELLPIGPAMAAAGLVPGSQPPQPAPVAVPEPEAVEPLLVIAGPELDDDPIVFLPGSAPAPQPEPEPEPQPTPQPAPVAAGWI